VSAQDTSKGKLGIPGQMNFTKLKDLSYTLKTDVDGKMRTFHITSMPHRDCVLFGCAALFKSPDVKTK
jgi:hypothetical protein